MWCEIEFAEPHVGAICGMSSVKEASDRNYNGFQGIFETGRKLIERRVGLLSGLLHPHPSIPRLTIEDTEMD